MARKIPPKINTRKLRIIGYFDSCLSICTIALVFYLVIIFFQQVDHNENNERPLNVTTEAEPNEKTRRGNIGLYSSIMFLVGVGFLEVLSALMLIQASELEKRERKKQFQYVEYWVDNAVEILILMMMAWFSLMAHALVDKKCETMFSNVACQVPYLVSCNIKTVLLVLVWQEKQKFTREDRGLKDEIWDTWWSLLGFGVEPKDDIEIGPSEVTVVQKEPVGGAKCMTGAKGRRNRQRARNKARKNRLRLNKVRRD